MPKPILYHDPTSEPSRAVHWLALEAGIELETRHVWLTRGEHMHPEFLAINPAHQVPALQLGQFTLAESNAIMIYLSEAHGIVERWIGATLEERASTHSFLSWHHCNTRLRVTLDYVLPALLMPAYNGHARPDSEQRQQLRTRAFPALAHLQTALEPRGRHLGGDQPNLADLFIASDLFALDADPERRLWFIRFPVLERWLERLRERPACAASLAGWTRVVPRIRELVSTPVAAPRSPDWVADACRPAE